VQLATVCALQFLPCLSDRDAAGAARCRIDFNCPVRSTSRNSPSLPIGGVLTAACPTIHALRPVTRTPEWLDIQITDNGPGSPPAASGGSSPASGHGLVGMRERVALDQDQLTAGPGEQGGFRVHARFPVAVAAVT